MKDIQTKYTSRPSLRLIFSSIVVVLGGVLPSTVIITQSSCD